MDEARRTDEALTLPELRCRRCGHRWHPREPRLPRVCPSCKSPYWDRERQADRQEAQADGAEG